MSALIANSFFDDDHAVATQLFPITPLTELSAHSRLQLSELLNCKKYLRAENGYERDWRGLAELAQVRSFCNTSSDDPMLSVLREWSTRYPLTATFAQLQHHLGTIDRWHVFDDIFVNLVDDAKLYALKVQEEAAALENETASTPPIAEVDTNNDATTDATSTTAPANNVPKANNDNINMEIKARENSLNATVTPFYQSAQSVAINTHNLITRDDIVLAQHGMPLQQYDAIVLYADADIYYAMEMQHKFEQNENYKFKLFFKNRDLLGGAFSHVALIELMDRCRYLLLILTENFLAMPENRFLMHYVQSEQIQDNTRKIIPLAYDNSLPKALRGLHTLKYNGSNEHFWNILADSIRAPDSVSFIPMNEMSVAKMMPYAASAPPLPLPTLPPHLNQYAPQTLPSIPQPIQMPWNIPTSGFSAQTYGTNEPVIQTAQDRQACSAPITVKKKRKPLTVLKSIFNRSS